MMSCGEWLTVLNILVAFLGVAFVFFAAIEWWRLRGLRKTLADLPQTIDARLEKQMRAAHRIMVSYGMQDVQAKISLLQSVVQECPEAFNAYNSPGYAWLEAGDTTRALDAFVQALHLHPQDKAACCDVAYAHMRGGNVALALRYCRKAIELDATARDDLLADSRFAAQHEAIKAL